MLSPRLLRGVWTTLGSSGFACTRRHPRHPITAIRQQLPIAVLVHFIVPIEVCEREGHELTTVPVVKLPARKAASEARPHMGQRGRGEGARGRRSGARECTLFWNSTHCRRSACRKEERFSMTMSTPRLSTSQIAKQRNMTSPLSGAGSEAALLKPALMTFSQKSSDSCHAPAARQAGWRGACVRVRVLRCACGHTPASARVRAPTA